MASTDRQKLPAGAHIDSAANLGRKACSGDRLEAITSRVARVFELELLSRFIFPTVASFLRHCWRYSQ
ncbi:hypothetical protein WJX75_002124 [Coccomyxa subellipsoidea]|uniref:Uncharacterized protein n=1 Tax=Coccomyxa subellipsoidea TaxID=248742 RepID=A0ABR2YKF7_9CHLO